MKMKIIVDSISRDEIDRNSDIEELEYLVSVIMYCMDHKSISNTRNNTIDRMTNDRMESYYSDELIDATIGIMNRILKTNTMDVLEYSIVNYVITITELNRLCVILKILVSKDLLGELR